MAGEGRVKDKRHAQSVTAGPLRKIALVSTLLSIFMISSASVPYRSSASLIEDPVFMCGTGLDQRQPSTSSVFESVPTRPLARSDDGSLLFAINSASRCLEIFAPGDGGLDLLSTVSVGVDPVSVAVRSRSEVWVVNHVSDSVSVVDIEGAPRVTDTLQVGDAPWDIVFADSGRPGRIDGVNRRDRAFITAAFRGQHHPQFSSEHLILNRLPTAGGEPGELIGRADVWVFDAETTAPPQLSGIVNLFTSSLRALAVDGAGERVFAVSFKSGNRTAVTPVPWDNVLGDKWSADGVGHVEPFAIVQQTGDKWLDAEGQNWPSFMNYDISDHDVFVLDASAPLSVGTPERPRFNRHAVLERVDGVGNVLFNAEFDDKNQRLLVSAVDANNIVPMEHNARGVFSSNHVKVIDFARSPATVRDINLDELMGAVGEPAGLALPSGMLISDNSDSLLVTSMGTNRAVAFDLDRALSGSGIGRGAIRSVDLPLGPIAAIADPSGETTYSYSYIDNAVTMHGAGIGEGERSFTLRMSNPELPAIQSGRRFLYDATVTSSNNRVSCASCHIFGGEDRLQWNLNKRGQVVLRNELPFVQHGNRKTTVRPLRLKHDPDKAFVGERIPLGDGDVEIKYLGSQQGFADRLASGAIADDQPGLVYLTESDHDPRLVKYKILTGQATWALIEAPFIYPLLGPMRTTPLHGINDSGAMHFLGDKAGLVMNEKGPCSDASLTQEQRAFREFNSPCNGGPGPFETLLGGPHLPAQHMDELTAFTLALAYPPNPIRPLSNQVNETGERIFLGQKIGTELSDWTKVMNKKPLIFACADCHTLSRQDRMFGTSKKIYSAPGLSMQDAKVPHLRFLYDRAGFLRGDYAESSEFLNMKQDNAYFDKVVHAQGLNHGGWFDFTLFFNSVVWILNENDVNAELPETKKLYRSLFDYLMQFDTNYYPMFGQQLTLSAQNIDDGATSEDLRRFFANALRPANAEDARQCDIHAFSPARRGPPQLLKSVVEATALARRSELPLTLTCL